MFQLLPVTEADLSSMVELWYDAFGDPINRRLYPDTPGARAWLEDYHRASLQSPDQHYLKVTTDHSTWSTSPLVAFVKWDFNTTSPGHHFPPRHVDFDWIFCDTFFGGLDQARRTIMGSRPHYYLDALITHPDYRRQGAASMLIQWGCKRADQDGIPIWVDSSQEGARIYQRFGFRDVSVLGLTPTGAMSMLRDPVGGDAA
ncbi:acyl-CoA N-acyltransferase [Aspergillus eucalypticola CBS 122712]|uniref:Acyl-CoA N-acyltransferase n=1 Tax=Aspergillus eucalypticola (strain CBS 122712 / IBT 29274) TaxID=1448314 RepID=A0A317WGR5_ASPEC|nr:acyl-CoA N-acyltransferase [Aspergillus eucalypticola CBS 122712]PWY84452.1 acyl-CoA N-acyltransferase [Aspergillus eucalypticola CBS 122712]